MRVAASTRVAVVAAFAASLGVAGVAHAGAARPLVDAVAVLVGADIGQLEEGRLRYAEADARRVRDVLLELGGLERSRAIMVLGGRPDGVQRALAEARGRVAELRAAGRRPLFIFYYSGHGDDQSLHLGDGVLDLPHLRAEIDAIPAEVHLSFLDACRTTGRSKGVHPGDSFRLYPAADQLHGSIEIRAAAAGETAQESDALLGGVFTHSLLSGLRGDADIDGDGRVTISELYTYAYRHTMLRTGQAGALQHPATSITLAGVGELVLSETVAASALLELPSGAEGYLVFAVPSTAVFAEAEGRGTTLALPAGRFLVARRGRGRVAVAPVDLSLGGRRQMRPSDFTPVAAEELTRRGGRLEVRHLRLDARFGAELAPRGPERFGGRAGIALAYTLGLFELDAELAYVGASAEATNLTGAAHALSGVLSVGVRGIFPRATISAALGVELRRTWESLEVPEPARARAAGLPSEESFRYGSMGPRLTLRALFPLGRNVSVQASVATAALVRHEGSDWSVSPQVSLLLGIGYGL
jgi:hypothetical protein